MKNELEYCKACGHQIAKSAKRCPNCGAKQKRSHPFLSFILVLLILAFLLFLALLVGAIADRHNQRPQNPSPSFSNATSSPTQSIPTNPTELLGEEQDDFNGLTSIRPEFKEMMDEYEAFFQGYCDFMKKFQEDPSNLSLMSEYVDVIKQYTEAVSALDAIETNELTEEELLYYLDVTARIERMLAEVAQDS